MIIKIALPILALCSQDGGLGHAIPESSLRENFQLLASDGVIIAMILTMDVNVTIILELYLNLQNKHL